MAEITRRHRRTSPVIAFVLSALLLAGGADAHPLAPALLELRQETAGDWTVTWKLPQLQPAGADLRPRLPPWCEVRGEAVATREADALRFSWTIMCGDRGLDGARVGIEGLTVAGTAALLRLVSAGGAVERWLLTAENPAREILRTADAPSRLGRAFHFAALGARRLLQGPAHAAFLLGLFLFVPRRRALLLAVTAFTVGHSASLSLAALGFSPLPAAVVEVGIAASVLSVAVALARRQSGVGLFARRPWAAAFGFGLLHGAGLAATLRTAGLAGDEFPLGVAAFNAGIEAGQVLFLGLLVIAAAAVRRLPWKSTAWLQSAPSYALGALAAFWMLERVAAALS